MNPLFEKQAHGFPRLMEIMTAQVPVIHTFAIMSVDNPQGKPLTHKENQKARDAFRAPLKEDHYGWIQTWGQYGGLERPFFIMNPRRADVIYWGEKFNQESVIYGTVFHQQLKVIFEYIEGSTVKATCDVVTNPKNKHDYKTTYKGRDFYIPFFDECPITDSNVPKECPAQMDELVHNEENLPHLATLHTCEEATRLDALSQKVGMSILMNRHKVLTALNSLKWK